MVAAIEDTSTDVTKAVTLRQKTDAWQNSDLQTELEALFNVDGYTCAITTVGDGKTATIAWAAPTATTTGHATITIA